MNAVEVDPRVDTRELIARIHDVRGKIERAAGGRTDVRLVGVSKLHPAEAIAAARGAGLRDFGENYAQELRDKRALLAELDLSWHMIGPVQRNKAKLVLGVALVHTVDRVELLVELERRTAAAAIAHQDVLVQVNVADEVGKSGAAPAALPALLDAFTRCHHVRCRGLMLIPPHGDAEATRPHFRALAALRAREAAIARPQVELAQLSMGMSDDYEVAIAEGATIVRVGTAIFGARPGGRDVGLS